MEFKFTTRSQEAVTAAAEKAVELGNPQISSDRKSTRLNSSH